MLIIRPLQEKDRKFWFHLDKHLPQSEFGRKVRDKMGYVLLSDNHPLGLLRYNLFWDHLPFCTMLIIDPEHQNRGLGKMLMQYWENEMKTLGHQTLLVSTQADETAQHFYRKLGYQDCGGLLIKEQATELFLSKTL